MEKKLSIIIPCFNEAENVKILLQKFQDILQETPHNLEIIIVDGCSTDKTPQVLTDTFKTLDSKNFQLILMPERNGYGHDILKGLNAATGDVLSWTHADLQTDPQDVIKAYEIYQTQKGKLAFIKGRRKNRKLLDTFFTFAMQIITWILLRSYLDDINAQPKLFSRTFYEKFLKSGGPNDFSLDLFALYQAKKNGYQIIDFPVDFAKRLHGEAKGGGGSWKNRINLIKRTFAYILKLKNKLEK